MTVLLGLAEEARVDFDTLLLRLQADRRALNITMNSIGTELTRDDRRKLYSNFGLLHPHGHSELAGAEDFDQIRSAMEKCPPYQAIFNKVCTSNPSLPARLCRFFHRSMSFIILSRCFVCPALGNNCNRPSYC